MSDLAITHAVFCILGAFQGFLVSIALILAKTNHHLANKILATTCIIFSIKILETSIIAFPNLLYSNANLLGVTYAWDLVYAPLFMFYIKALTIKDFSFQRKDWLHFIPFALSLIMHIPTLLLPEVEKIAILKHWLEAVPYQASPEAETALLFMWFNPLFVTVQYIVYLMLNLRLLKQHEQRIKQQFSSIDKIKLGWLRMLLLSCFLAWVAYYITIAIPSLFQFKDYTPTETIFLTSMAIALLIYTIAYMGLRQPDIFLDNSETQDNADAAAAEKYQTSSLTDEQAARYQQKLLAIIENDKPHLNCDLTAKQLARQLGTTTYYLSQILNGYLKQNFFDFINYHRIEEAKRLLVDSDKKLSVLEVALEAGFNSKSSFYTAFKKITDMTPTQYRKTHGNLVNS